MRAPGPQTTRAHLREIERTASDNLAEARRFVRALTPPALDDAPLPEALRRLTAGVTAGPEVRFHLDGEPRRLPVEAEVALLRLTQEALANVARHAHAERAAVTLAFLDGQVTLDVYDDGVGFTPGGSAGGAARTTFGLHGMRERIAELGGTLTVESAPGEGTAVAAALPVPEPERAGEAASYTARTDVGTEAARACEGSAAAAHPGPRAETAPENTPPPRSPARNRAAA